MKIHKKWGKIKYWSLPHGSIWSICLLCVHVFKQMFLHSHVPCQLLFWGLGNQQWINRHKCMPSWSFHFSCRSPTVHYKSLVLNQGSDLAMSGNIFGCLNLGWGVPLACEGMEGKGAAQDPSQEPQQDLSGSEGQRPQHWKRSLFIPIPEKGTAKECSNYCTIALISHASKVMLKILQARLQ